MSKIVCECCGDDKAITQSYEDIKQYPNKVLVTHCATCELSLYAEPEPTSTHRNSESSYRPTRFTTEN